MAFKIAARTILQLGGELISSDDVALYELIKNAFDADSKKGVRVEIVVRLKSWPGEWQSRLEKLPAKNSEALTELKQALLRDADSTAPGAADWGNELKNAKDADTLRAVVEQANEIIISDTGHGMSKADLNEVYLTIGTRYRLEEKQAMHQNGRKKERAILGEKGLGRLSVMRLGQRVRVKTTRAGEPDYEAALTFTLSEATRLVGQLRREQLQPRELSLTIRFNDFTEAGSSHRFQHAQFQNSVINSVVQEIFRDVMSRAFKPVRQIRIGFWNLSRLDTQPTLWGTTDAERWGALDEAAHKLNTQFVSAEKPALMTGAQLALRQLDDAHKNPKSKCPFVPQREMVKKLWGTDADPLAHKGDWEKRLAKISKQHQFTK